MYRNPHEDYQPQHPMLARFEPTAGMFDRKCSKPSDEAIEAWYAYYIENGGIGHKQYKKNANQYEKIRKQYGCYINPKKAYELMMKLRRKRENKAALEEMEAEGISPEGVWRLHLPLSEFEASAGKKKKNKHEIPPSWHGSLVGGNCKKPSDEDVIKWWKYYHKRRSASDQWDGDTRKRHANSEKKAFKKLQSAKKCGIRKAAVDKLILKVPEDKRKAAGIELK